jgi:hypothetical protein
MIQATKFAKGGILQGKSHAEGGIALGGNQEAEGGEPILTKGVSKNPILLKFASLINQLGGGIDFANVNINTPKMAKGGVAVPQVEKSRLFERAMMRLANFQPVVLEGVTDRDIYRASISGRPVGAF